MSGLTAEQKMLIEEKRKLALEKKAAAEARNKTMHTPSPVTAASKPPISSFYPSSNAGQRHQIVKKPCTVTSNSLRPLQITYQSGPSDPKKMKMSSGPGSSLAPTKVTAGLCKMTSADRFTVVAAYHQQMIDTFKNIPSRIYDAQSRNWNFLVKDHDLLMRELKSLGSSISISPLPKQVRAIFERKKKDNTDVSDLSKIDSKILNALLPFQEEGVRFCIKKHGRAMIADDMGLGKTIQALAVAHYYKEDWPLMIVCPSSVRFTWAEAIHSWLPSVPMHSVVVMTSGKDFVEDAKVLILSYDLLSKQGDDIMKMKQKFNMLILDESHSLKNFKTCRSKAVQPFAKKARRVLLLSGTPALSRPMELQFQLCLISPDCHVSYQDYGIRYCNGQLKSWGWDYTGASNMDELNLMLKECYMIRRLKSEVLTQLPAKFRQVVVLPPGSVNMKTSDLKAAEKGLRYASDAEKQGALLVYFNATGTAKLKGVCSYIMDMVKDDKKFLCFAHHKIVLDSICEKLRAANYGHIRIDGSTESQKRQELVNKFQDDDRCRVAVLSITAANTGLTLTAAHLVVFAELFWNPGVLIQAEDRAHRISQKDSVVVQYLVAQGTADDHLWTMLQRKIEVLNKAGLNKDNIVATASTKRLMENGQQAITNFLIPKSSEEEALDDEFLASLDIDALVNNSGKVE